MEDAMLFGYYILSLFGAFCLGCVVATEATKKRLRKRKAK